jgi:hypothetical protein
LLSELFVKRNIIGAIGVAEGNEWCQTIVRISFVSQFTKRLVFLCILDG